MKGKGQLQLEAIICFAAFLAVLGFFLGSMNETAAQAENAAGALNAKSSAQLCCIAADAIYAAGVAEFLPEEMQCTAKGSVVEGRSGDKIKENRCLAEQIRLVQKGGKSILEVQLCEHYR